MSPRAVLMSSILAFTLLLATVVLLILVDRRLRASERRYRHLVEHSLGLICCHDLDGKLLWINPEAARILGYDPRRAVGVSVAAVLAPWARPQFEDYLDQIRRLHSASGFMRILTKEGGNRIWFYRNVLFEDHVLGYALDVTELHESKRELKKTQQELEERVAQRTAELQASVQMFRSLNLCCPVGIFQTDVEGRLTYLNPRCQSILGLGEGHHLDEGWARSLHPEDRAAALASWHEVVLKGRPYLREFRLRPAGGVTRWVRLHTAPLLDDQGQIVGHAGAVEDLTERRYVDEQLRQAQKMEAVGKLAGGVAHDFNNILTAIHGYSELLLERPECSEPMRRDIEEVRKAAQRAGALTRQLLDFSRRQVLQSKVLDLNALLADLYNLLRRVIGEDVDLRIIPGPALRLVKADPGQLEQVILNLAVNARDAMPHGGLLTIETRNDDLDAAYVDLHPGVQPGRYVKLTVSDGGSGMDEETCSRLFEPFFTTKVGQGTGLGLSIVYGVVQQSGGHLRVESQLGAGTTFEIYLPQTEAAAAEEPEPPAAEPAAGGSETILLVEDELPVRDLVRTILERSGYSVLEAGDGVAALTLAQTHPGSIDLLFTDMVMPGLSGPELLQLLEPHCPSMQVLYMSGYADRIVPGKHFLQKPFTKEALVRKVREVLEGRRYGTIGA
jgi:two-component system cell cycle sensor histidine kinase/response regulator CckA